MAWLHWAPESGAVAVEAEGSSGATGFLNLNSRFKFKPNTFSNVDKFKYFTKIEILGLSNQNNFETQIQNLNQEF
jgi:hypothetical protein